MTTELTTYQFDPMELPGATRIGHIWLFIPPLNIHLNNPKFEDVMMTMRQQGGNYVKTGHGLLSVDMDIVFSGKDMINNKLAKIIAMFRRTPIITIWNETLRKMIDYVPDPDEIIDNEIPVVVNGYTLNTEPDLPDTITMRLSVLVYNIHPYVRNIEYLRQEVDASGNFTYNNPATSIEDSNLWMQFSESLVRDPIAPSEFMFNGEIDANGYMTRKEREAITSPQNDTFVSRTSINADVLRNGEVVCRVGDDLGSAEAHEEVQIGYHTHDLEKVFDLRLGAYKSRITNDWITNEDDMRNDLATHLDRDILLSESLKDVIKNNLDKLFDLPVINTSNKYIKLYTLRDSSTVTIDGITVRRSIPISVLPILSSHIPTIQYLGGAETDITLTMVTANEDLVETVSAVGQMVEADARDARRISGGSLCYMANDIVNLNGTLIVNPGTLDIQSVPENPGSYIITWIFNEQTEPTAIMDNKWNEKRKLKKQILQKIFTHYQNWTYSKSQANDSDNKFTFDSVNPSYVETLLIPSMVRLVRNAFIKWLKDQERWDANVYTDSAGVVGKLAWLGVESVAKGLGITGSYDPELNTDILFGDWISPSDSIAAKTYDVDASGNTVAVATGGMVLSRQKAYSGLWKRMVGLDTTTTPKIYNKFLLFMMTQAQKDSDFSITTTNTKNGNNATENRKSTLIAGSLYTILTGDCRRFELLLRSSQLLKYEMGLIGYTKTSLSQKSTQGGVFTSYTNRWGESFVVRKDILQLFNKFSSDLKTKIGYNAEVISAWRGEKLQSSLDSKVAANFGSSSHSFGVAIDFNLVGSDGSAISRDNTPANLWTDIGTCGKKYFTWGYDMFTDPSQKLEERNHLCLKGWGKDLAARYRKIYSGYYQSGEKLLQFGVDTQTATDTSVDAAAFPLDLIDGSEYISCYRDLGIPFSYKPYDKDGNLAKTSDGKLVDPRIMEDPTFYMRSWSPLNSENMAKSNSTINQNIKVDSASLHEVTHAGGHCASIERPFSRRSNEIGLKGYEPADSTNSRKSTKDISKTEAELQVEQSQNVVNQSIASLNKAGLTDANTPTSFGTFKSIDELFLTNSLVKSMGNFGSETNPLVIAEAEYEHKLFRSSFKDYNADIDKTLATIIKNAREEITNNDKYYSMTRAYPTFKLYFREENSPEWFLFDNFYDYRSIESIRFYKDKVSPGAEAHIVLHNINNSLTDINAMLSKESFVASARNDEYRVVNQYTDKPIKSLFLQPGTQIQVRMGYEANPDDMPAIFNGYVSVVNPGEKYEIICQSYGIELMTEADVGSFLGWVCPPKAFIWWMLLDSKVKHLGRLVQASVLPNSATDYIDGPAFDDNIYIDQEMEPGTYRYLQAYNADNMKKWEVLQDIAAAHPGFICQVVPFDDRETVFFGRPDDFYKFTQDLGVTKKYIDLPMDKLPLLGGDWNSLNQTISIDHGGKTIKGSIRQIFQQFVDKEYPNTFDLNYLQWLKYKDKIEETFEQWRIHHGANATSDPQGWWSAKKRRLLLARLAKYGRLVDILTSIAADGNTGNIQYQLGEDIPTEIEYTTSDYGLNSTKETPGVTLTHKSEDNAEIARIALDVIKNRPSTPITAAMLDHLDSNVKSAVLRSITGRTIPLKDFLNDDDAKVISWRLCLGDIPSTEKAQAALQDNLSTLLKKYDLIKDSKQIKKELKTLKNNGNRGIEDIELMETATRVYKKFGIESPIAIACWYKIASIWSKILTSFTSDVQDGTKMGLDLIGTSYEADNRKSVSFTGYIPFNLAVQPNLADPSIQEAGDTITFSGPIWRSDLKTHIMFKNMIQSALFDVNPEFQKVIGEMGHGPNQRRFRQYHLATSYEHIVKNNIKVNFDSVFNRVRVKYKRCDFMDYSSPQIASLIFGDKLNNEFEIEAGDTLDDKITREVTIPIINAKTVHQARNYATSILADGIRNMYSGQLILLGNPNIKPHDIIMIYDDYNKMYGPIEVSSVTHVMSAETGFISIVEPHAYVDMVGEGPGPASIIKEIFDIASLALLVVPPLAGAGRTASLLSKAKWSEGISNMLAKGAALGETAIASASNGVRVSEKVLQTGFATNLKEALLKTDSIFSGKNLTELTDAINAARKAKNPSAAAITTFDEASRSEITSALKTVLKAENGSQLSGKIDVMVADSSIKAAMTAAADVAKTAIKGAKSSITPKNFITSITGMTFVNLAKTLAVVAPITYYQMFAGMDDDNYACPLRITPLSYAGSPYQAGLDGITHRSGIWQHIQGEWRRFFGSANTVASALSEYYTNLTGESI